MLAPYTFVALSNLNSKYIPNFLNLHDHIVFLMNDDDILTWRETRGRLNRNRFRFFLFLIIFLKYLLMKLILVYVIDHWNNSMLLKLFHYNIYLILRLLNHLQV